MWFSAGMLLFGNAVIGIFEGYLLLRYFRLSRVRCYFSMIVANYLSMFVGALFLGSLDNMFAGLVGYETYFYLGATSIALLIVLFVMISILVETPFVWWALRPAARGLGMIFIASMVVNGASNLLLAPLYYKVSRVSFYTELTLDRGILSDAKPSATVYYLSEEDSGLWRASTRGTGPERVLAILPCQPDRWDSMLLLRENSGDTAWNLFMVSNRESSVSDTTGTLLLPDAAAIDKYSWACWDWRTGAPDTTVAREDQRHYREMQLRAFGGSDGRLLLLPGDTERWWVKAGFWAAQGITIENVATNTRYRFAVEMPIRQWPARYPTLIPGHRVVSQLGENIVLIDLDQNKAALLGRGYAPVPVME